MVVAGNCRISPPALVLSYNCQYFCHSCSYHCGNNSHWERLGIVVEGSIVDTRIIRLQHLNFFLKKSFLYYSGIKENYTELRGGM